MFKHFHRRDWHWQINVNVSADAEVVPRTPVAIAHLACISLSTSGYLISLFILLLITLWSCDIHSSGRLAMLPLLLSVSPSQLHFLSWSSVKVSNVTVALQMHCDDADDVTRQISVTGCHSPHQPVAIVNARLLVPPQHTPCLKKLCKIVFVRTSLNFHQVW